MFGFFSKRDKRPIKSLWGDDNSPFASEDEFNEYFSVGLSQLANELAETWDEDEDEDEDEE